jgi:hypothetical protein
LRQARNAVVGPAIKSGPPLPDLEALRIRDQVLGGSPSIRPGVNWGATANMGLGAMNILGFLPTILEGGNIMQGTSRMLPKFGMYSRGGMARPKYFNSGGMVKSYAKGGDIVPSMLTPGEFVMSKYAVQNYGVDKMKSMNSGTYNGDSVYNYNLSVNVTSDANPDDIARTVMTQIRQVESQRIRSAR